MFEGITMRRDKILAALLVVLLVYSAFTTWKWQGAEKSKDNAIDDLEGLANHEAICLEQSGVVSYLLDKNASDETLLAYSRLFEGCARVLELAEIDLYILTKDPKHYDLHVFGSTLETLFHKAAFDSINGPRPILLKNEDRIANISRTLKDLMVKRKGLWNLTPEDIKKLREMAEEIEWN